MAVKTKMAVTEIRVMGETGNEYVVALRNGEATCSCPAFAYNDGPCKHMTFVVALLAAGGAS